MQLDYHEGPLVGDQVPAFLLKFCFLAVKQWQRQIERSTDFRELEVWTVRRAIL